MKAVIFTYYSNSVEDIFVENINSLVSQSKQKYSAIVICSQVDVPIKISKQLFKHFKVIRIYPDHVSKTARKFSATDRSLIVNPFILTALSYTAADLITVFDPNLFVINEYPAYDGENIFYKTHTGVISPSLFTIRRDAELSKVSLAALAQTDFTDPIILSRFTYLVSNGWAFSPKKLISDKFVFSYPNPDDKINQSKLIALDFTNTVTSLNVHKEMWQIRDSLLPKVTTLIKITKAATALISKIEKNLAALSYESTSRTFMNNYRILFKYTSRSRPDLFDRGVASIFNNCNSSNFIIFCSLDEDDPTLPEYKAKLATYSKDHVKVVYGTSKNKIDAINRDINDHTGNWDIIINMSDDMVFIEYGFDEVIRQAFDNDLDQFIHFSDGSQLSNLCTMTIEGKDYYRRFNYIYHPSYISLWCDLEAQDVAKKLGKYKYMGDDVQILKHLHPANGLAEYDEQYKKTESKNLWNADQETYNSRKKLGFVTDRIDVLEHTPKFSILILSVEERFDMFNSLVEEFNNQINRHDGECEILFEIDNGFLSTGEKRNSILSRAKGDYVAFFDDDDWPSPNYIGLILEAIKTEPDCCSLLGEMTTNGMNPEVFEHSIKYSAWKTNPNGPIKYERNPNHLNAIKASIAKSIKFPTIDHGEDHAWSKKLKDSGLLKTEAHIKETIYYYRYIQK